MRIKRSRRRQNKGRDDMRTIYRNGAVYTGELPLCRAFVVEDG